MSNQPTDHQLQLALAKMLSDKIGILVFDEADVVVWRHKMRQGSTLSYGMVQDTEWLHVCWLIEQTLSDDQIELLIHCLRDYMTGAYVDPRWQKSSLSSKDLIVSASWQQRAIALAPVKGVTI